MTEVFASRQLVPGSPEHNRLARIQGKVLCVGRERGLSSAALANGLRAIVWAAFSRVDDLLALDAQRNEMATALIVGHIEGLDDEQKRLLQAKALAKAFAAHGEQATDDHIEQHLVVHLQETGAVDFSSLVARHQRREGEIIREALYDFPEFQRLAAARIVACLYPEE